MTNLADLAKYNNDLYNNEMYADDENTQNMLALLVRAASLTPQAQAEFVKVWNFEYALDGQVRIPAHQRAIYPALVAEAAAAGIEIVAR